MGWRTWECGGGTSSHARPQKGRRTYIYVYIYIYIFMTLSLWQTPEQILFGKVVNAVYACVSVPDFSFSISRASAFLRERFRQKTNLEKGEGCLCVFDLFQTSRFRFLVGV